MTTVLVVDDEVQIRRALTLNLRARGYTVLAAGSAEHALQMAASEHPDLVLLDLGLPGMDGLEAISALRGWSTVPIIVLTVRDDERSKVRALDEGADDYVTKPFGMDELLARLRAALRRALPAAEEVSEVVTEAWTVDFVARRVTLAGGGAVRLTPVEWALVTPLLRNPDRLLTYRQLIDAVWGPTYDPDSNLLRVHMTHLRRKLEPEPARPRYLITESGMGYRFTPERER